MRKWKRAPFRLTCGAAQDCWIQSGDPYLELGREQWTARRCASHADEAVPAVIDGHEVPAPGFTTLRQLVTTATRRDPKMRQANDDGGQ